MSTTNSNAERYAQIVRQCLKEAAAKLIELAESGEWDGDDAYSLAYLEEAIDAANTAHAEIL